MFTINRTIVSEAYGINRALFPTTTYRPKGQTTDTSRSQQPQFHHPTRKSGKYTSNDQRLDLPLQTQISPPPLYDTKPNIKVE